eukprot:12562354-Ditylum_brightwellii.AAC.1
MPLRPEISPFEEGNKAGKATDFANYFCSSAQFYQQKQMLADHNKMAPYHTAMMGNSSVFKDKVVIDVRTGSLESLLFGLLKREHDVYMP